MKKIKKILSGLLVMLMVISLTGCMENKVKSITVKISNVAKLMNVDKDGIEYKAVNKSVSECKWVFNYSKDEQKLVSSKLTIIIDINKLKSTLISEFKKSEEFKDLQAENTAYAIQTIREVEKSFDEEFSYESIKKEYSGYRVKKLSDGRIKISETIKDLSDIPNSVKKIDDNEEVKKKIKKELKKFLNLSDKDFKTVVKNY